MSPNGRTAVPLMARNRRRRAIHRQWRDGSAAERRADKRSRPRRGGVIDRSPAAAQAVD